MAKICAYFLPLLFSKICKQRGFIYLLYTESCLLSHPIFMPVHLAQPGLIMTIGFSLILLFIHKNALTNMYICLKRTTCFISEPNVWQIKECFLTARQIQQSVHLHALPTHNMERKLAKQFKNRKSVPSLKLYFKPNQIRTTLLIA